MLMMVFWPVCMQIRITKANFQLQNSNPSLEVFSSDSSQILVLIPICVNTQCPMEAPSLY